MRDYHQVQAGVAQRPFFRVDFNVVNSYGDIFGKEKGAKKRPYRLSILLERGTKGLTNLRWEWEVGIVLAMEGGGLTYRRVGIFPVQPPRC
jgi:hypothetical protein